MVPKILVALGLFSAGFGLCLFGSTFFQVTPESAIPILGKISQAAVMNGIFMAFVGAIFDEDKKTNSKEEGR